MAQRSPFVLLSLLCCSGVQGIAVDFSDSLHAVPKFAGLLQQHLGEDSHSKSPWKAQAQMFLGLLQSMGGQVPADKKNETTHYVNQIIDLLTGSKDDIYQDAKTTKETTQSQLNDEWASLQTAEHQANEAKTNTEAADADLQDCYDHLNDIGSNHSIHCGDKALPAACDRKNNTKMHTFDVATKDTWKCNFTAGSDPDKCTSATSPLKTDLVSHRDALRAAYQAWKLQNKTCQDDLDAEHELCQNTNNTYWGKKAICQEKYMNVSDHLCHFREKIDEWTTSRATLTTTQTRAKTLLPPKLREWTDLNLIICMLKKFRDREQMTFKEPDYGQCEAEAGGLEWVGEIDTLEPQTEVLVSASLYKEECQEYSFSGGLATKYEIAPVVFFTEAEVSFSFNKDGSGGCTSTTVAKTKVCSEGMRVTVA